MPHYNTASREVTLKIVYYGPGVGGKTTNLEQVFQMLDPGIRGRLLEVKNSGERTLFFDMLPVEGSKVLKGFQVRFHLYTVPGQVYYNATRRKVLENVDGIIFVADSTPDRLEANQEALQNMYDNLSDIGLDASEIPLVFQYNKQDRPGALPDHILDEALNPEHVPAFLAVASEGIGVMDTLQQAILMVEQQFGQSR